MKFETHELVLVDNKQIASVWNYNQRDKEYTVITAEHHKVTGIKEEQLQHYFYNGQAIFWVSEEHKLNYKRLLARWPRALKDTEYQTACYIMSVPMIYQKVSKYTQDFEYPTSWIWSYLEWSKEYKKEWEDYSRYRDYDEEHPDETAWRRRKRYDLTGSMVQLGNFSLNMWNSYDGFNLMDCLGTVDNNHFNVLKCAIDMRIGKFRGR